MLTAVLEELIVVGFEEPRQAAEQASTPAEIEERRRPGRNDHVSPPLIPLLRNPAAPSGDDWAPVIDVTFDLALEAMTFWTGIAETIWGVRRQTKAALIGFRGGEASTGKRGWGPLVHEQKRE